MSTRSYPSHIFLVVVAALIVVVASTFVWQHTRPRLSVYIVGDPQRGADLFFGSKQCRICHSVGGRVAPELSA